MLLAIVGSLPQPADNVSSPPPLSVSPLVDELLSLSVALEPLSSPLLLPLTPDVELLSLDDPEPPDPPLVSVPPLPPEGPVLVALELVPVGAALLDVAVELVPPACVEVALV